MFDNHAGRLAEAFDTFQGGIGISHIVIGQRFALQLPGGGHAGFQRRGFCVKRSGLMGIFPVAHVLHLDELGVERAREWQAVPGGQGLSLLVDAAQVVGDHAVIGCRVLEGFQGQIKALRVGQASGFQGFKNAVIVGAVDHDGHVFVVFGRAAHHGRSANIDVFDGFGQAAVWPGYRGGEGVEVDRDQVNRGNAVSGHDAVILATPAEDTAMDFRVQGLDPAIHHFRKAGVIRHFNGRNTVFTQQPERASGGENFHAETAQGPGKLKNTGFVGNADQGPANGKAGELVGHIRSIRVGYCEIQDGRQPRAWRESEQVVLLEFFAQGPPVQPQQFGGAGLVAPDMGHDGLQKGRFNFRQDHLVNIGHFRALQMGKIIAQGLFHTVAQGLACFAGRIQMLLEIGIVAH